MLSSGFKRSTRKRSPRKRSPRKRSPRKRSPRKRSPRKRSNKKTIKRKRIYKRSKASQKRSKSVYKISSIPKQIVPQPIPAEAIKNVLPIPIAKTIPVSIVGPSEKDFLLKIIYYVGNKGVINLRAFVQYTGNDLKIQELLKEDEVLERSLIFISLSINANRTEFSEKQNRPVTFKHYLNSFYNYVTQRNINFNEYPQLVIFKGLAHTILCYLLQFGSSSISIDPDDIIGLMASGSLPDKPITELYRMYERLGFKNHIWLPETEANKGYAYLYGTIRDVENICEEKNVKQFLEDNFTIQIQQDKKYYYY